MIDMLASNIGYNRGHISQNCDYSTTSKIQNEVAGWKLGSGKDVGYLYETNQVTSSFKNQTLYDILRIFMKF